MVLAISLNNRQHCMVGETINFPKDGNSLGVCKRLLAAGHRVHSLQVYSKGEDLDC